MPLCSWDETQHEVAEVEPQDFKQGEAPPSEGDP